MKNIIKNIKIDNIIMIFIGILSPWSILFATPQLHIGYWGQVEGMIIFNHFVSALIALLLIRIGIIAMANLSILLSLPSFALIVT